MDTLASMVSTGEVRRALQKLPSDPDAMYTDALKRINAQHISKRQWALSILGWMVHMQRPLQLDELRHALLIGDNMGNGALQPGDPPFFDHSYLLSREDILAFSCGLVEIDANNEDTVKLIHFTAQEFFDERRLEYFPNFHARIALACAKYLCLPRLEVADPDRPEERQYGEYTSSDLRDGPNDYTEEFREYERLRDYSKCKEEIRLGKRIDKLDEYEYIVRHVIVPKNVDCRRPWGPLPAKDYTNGSGVLRVLNPGEKLWLYPFTVYAGNFMAHHFRNIGDDDSRAVVEDQTRMLWERPQKLALQKWIICKLSWDIGLQLETLTDYAAFVGSPRLLELYSKGLPIAVREKALEIAIQNGCSHVVKALLSTGLVNLTSFNGHCLLLGAAQKGFLREVNEVVCSIADSLERAKRYRKSRTVMTRTKDWFDGQPRLDTSKHGQHFPGLSMIKLEAYIRLLEASASGNAAAVRQLFENQSVDAAISADPAAKVKPNKVLEIETKAHLVKTSFFLCAENSHEQAVEVLLDNGIDVDARDNEWQTPLLRAVYRDSWPIMKLLLRKGATIDWRMWMIDERPDRGEGETKIFLAVVLAVGFDVDSNRSSEAVAQNFSRLWFTSSPPCRRPWRPGPATAAVGPGTQPYHSRLGRGHTFTSCLRIRPGRIHRSPDPSRDPTLDQKSVWQDSFASCAFHGRGGVCQVFARARGRHLRPRPQWRYSIAFGSALSQGRKCPSSFGGRR